MVAADWTAAMIPTSSVGASNLSTSMIGYAVPPIALPNPMNVVAMR